MWRQSGLILQNIKRPEEKFSDHEWMRIRLYFFRRAILFRFLMRERHSSCTSTTHTDCSGAWQGRISGQYPRRKVVSRGGRNDSRSDRSSFPHFARTDANLFQHLFQPRQRGRPGPSAGGLNSSPAPLLVLI